MSKKYCPKQYLNFQIWSYPLKFGLSRLILALSSSIGEYFFLFHLAYEKVESNEWMNEWLKDNLFLRTSYLHFIYNDVW